MHSASNASPTKEITQTLFLGVLFLWMLIDVFKENGKQKRDSERKIGWETGLKKRGFLIAGLSERFVC